MNVTTVRLRGTAAVQAQHLAADLIDEGYEITPSEELEHERSLESVAADIVIGLGVSATYDVVKHAVESWARRHGIDDYEIVVEREDEEDDD